MKKMVTLKIDGKEVQVPEGTNIIEAAGSVGIHIPNLCYLKGMKGVGACRLCLVEVEGMKRQWAGDGRKLFILMTWSIPYGYGEKL